MSNEQQATGRSCNKRGKLAHMAIAPLAAACAAALSADFALAQEDDEGLVLEEIVVTSRFREESLQQIPLAITALTAEMLAANGATNVIDIADWAPNVTIDQLGSGWGPTLAANVRGLGYGDFKPTTEPTVQFYVDDVVMARPTGAILDLLDLERVEVLRGPQGTLFGKNAIGGVVRLVSRKPGEDPGGNIEVTVGNYDQLDVRGSFDTTLIDDTLFSRVSFVSKRRQGWQNNVDFRCAMVESGRGELAGVGDGIMGWDGGPVMVTDPNDPAQIAADNAFALPTRVSERGTDRNCVVGRFGDQNMEAARGSLRFVPNDTFELNINADVTDQQDSSPYDLISDIAQPGLIRLYNAAVALPTWGVPYDARFASPDIYTNYSGFNDNGGIDNGIETPNINNVTHWGASATLDWSFEAVDVKLILAQREFDAQWGRDSDGSPMPINHTLDTFRHEQDSIELRVSGTLFDDRTSWTIGYFDLDQYDLNTNISVLFPNTNCNTTFPDPGNRTGLIGVACIDRVDNVWVNNSGAFLNTVTDLTDRLSLTVGLRRSEDNKDILQERFNRDGSPNPGFEDPILVLARAQETDPMISLAYQVNDEIMVYGTYQEGFRGGGTTPRPSPGIRVPFGPEQLENVEIGIKSDLLDGRLRLNASYYDMTYSDLQRGAAGLDEFGNPAWLTTNAGEAELDGFEIEAQSTIGQNWLIEGSLSNLNFQLTDLGNASPEARIRLGLDPAGAPDINDGPNRSPEWSATLNFGYITTLDNGAEVSFRYGLSWRDDAWWGADGNADAPGNLVPAHSVSNARLTWVAPDQEWQASLFCTNCGDERTTQSTLNFLGFFGSLQQTYIDPERWGLSITRNF